VTLYPFVDAHHHNQIFLDPLIFKVSPLLHLASLATYTPPLLLGILGNHQASIVAWSICFFPNVTQHLGFDPFPWLTRWNHYYFWGALPWIPHYHSYHHNPFIKDGCYGNTTVLFDYVFGTHQPECIYHIENGKPMEKVMEKFKDPEKLDRILNSMYHAGKGKNRFDLNDEGYDWSLIPDGLEK
jgi:sterol desaturase/sphingolipid hydroxylase (fatty acid hydroxylase superfamily)